MKQKKNMQNCCYLNVHLNSNHFFQPTKIQLKKNLTGSQSKIFENQVIKKHSLEEPFLKKLLVAMDDEMIEALNLKIIKSKFKKDKELADSLCNRQFDEAKMIEFLKGCSEKEGETALFLLSCLGFEMQSFLEKAVEEEDEKEKEAEKVEEVKKTDTDTTTKKYKQQITDLKNEKAAIKAKLDKLQKDYNEIQKKNKKLSDDNKDLVSEKEGLAKEYKKLTDEVKELRDKLRKAKKETNSNVQPVEETNQDDSTSKVDDEKIVIDIEVVLDNLEDRTLLGIVKPNDIQIDRGSIIVTPIVPIVPDNSNIDKDILSQKVYYQSDYSTFNMPIDADFLKRCFSDEEIKKYQYATFSEKFNILFEALYRKILFFKPIFTKRNDETKYRLSADLIAKPFPLEDFNNSTFVPHYLGSKKAFENAVNKHEILELSNYPASLSSILRYVFVENALYQINYVPVTQDKTGQYIRWAYNGPVDDQDYRRFELKIANEPNDKYVLTPSDNFGDEYDLYVKNSVLLQPSFKTTPLWDEEDFIYKIGQNAKSQNLYYSEEDLKNFHIAIKSSNLVILAGPSGIGKTKLPMIYANTLGLDNVQNAVLFVPISPSYLEPEDVLGYIRPISEGEYNAEYMESQTGLVSFLNDAAEHKDRIHLVVFDEMNLSQIEHWFAPFISLLEQEPGSRVLNLYSNNTVVKNGDKYPRSINIGENVFFIGTVNIDETTKQMSDRLLDRAIVINLAAPSFESLKDIKDTKAEIYPEVSFSRFSTSMAKIDNATNEFVGKEFDLINELNTLFTESAYNRSISFRSLYKMALFLKNSKNILSRSDAIDFVISQIVVKKINGAKEELEGVISDDDTQGIIKILNSYSDVSKFNKTRKVVSQKIQEISKYGFTK